MTPSRSLIPVSIACTILMGCSRLFLVLPGGDLESGIFFEFGLLDGSRTRNRIVAFYVSENRGSSDRELIWSLEGRARLDQIRYGEAPKGLEEQMPAVTLQPMRIYEVGAADDPRGPMKGPGGAYTVFYISATRSPVQCESVAQCREELRHALDVNSSR